MRSNEDGAGTGSSPAWPLFPAVSERDEVVPLRWSVGVVAPWADDPAGEDRGFSGALGAGGWRDPHR